MRALPPAKHGHFGYLLAAGLLLGLGGLLTLLILPVGIGFIALLAVPALIHSAFLIHSQSERHSLPWEDQCAAVVVSFVLQIPLWLSSGFVAFLVIALLENLPLRNTIEAHDNWSISGFYLLWMVVSLLAYLGLFAVSFRLMRGYVYHDDPNSKTISLRDTMSVHHPC